MTTSKPFDLITTRTDRLVDRGWSWVVMMAAFGSMFIVIGYQRSFGLLFVVFQEKYGYSSAHLSVVNGTQMLIYSFSTMFVMNYLLKKISIRTSALCGACIQAAGIMGCSLSSNMVSLIVFQGVFFGVGHSMLYCPTILLVSQYFEVRRSLATSVAMCGASAGGITFPYITRFLLNIFGLEGALLLLGALILNQTVFFALFKPIIIESNAQKDAQPSNLSRPEEKKVGNKVPKIKIDLENEAAKSSPPENNAHEEEEYNQNHDVKESLLGNTESKNAVVARLSSSQILDPVSKKSTRGTDRLYSSQVIVPHGLLRDRSLSSKSKEFLNIIGACSTGFEDAHHASLPMLTQSLMQQREQGRGLELSPSKSPFSMQRHTGHSSSNVELASHIEEDFFKRAWIPDVMRLSSFWLVAAYNVGGIIAAGCPAVFIPPLAKERGLSDADGAFFLMISAVTDFVGRIVSGAVLHFQLLEPCNLALIPLFMHAALFSLTTVFHTFSTILLLTLNYGFCSSLFWTLQSLVMIDVLGLEYLGPAMGFYAVIYGLTTSASFPFAGWLHDEFGSYSASFVYFGAMSLLAALALILVQVPRYRSRCSSGSGRSCLGRRHSPDSSTANE